MNREIIEMLFNEFATKVDGVYKHPALAYSTILNMVVTEEKKVFNETHSCIAKRADILVDLEDYVWNQTKEMDKIVFGI